ncbi:MAG: hypothetical protein LM590_15610, partial [Thermofilum sp.]|nr:hypothetical protein [Thermofilum sp.]
AHYRATRTAEKHRSTRRDHIERGLVGYWPSRRPRAARTPAATAPTGPPTLSTETARAPPKSCPGAGDAPRERDGALEQRLTSPPEHRVREAAQVSHAENVTYTLAPAQEQSPCTL